MRRGRAPAVLAAALLLAAASPLTIAGQVSRPGPLAPPALAALRQVSVTAAFDTMHGPASHTWRGPLLRDVLDLAAVIDAPGKHTRLRHAVLASGADGYAVAVAYGELLDECAGKMVILALTQDGKPLDAPRLIVPGDRSFARGVFDVARLTVE